MRFVPLIKLNETVFQDAPVPLPKLQRWCRRGALPARKFGGEWKVDVDALSQTDPTTPDTAPDPVMSKLFDKLAS